MNDKKDPKKRLLKARSDLAKSIWKARNKIYNRPTLHFDLDEVGELYLGWTIERYVHLKVEKWLPIFFKAHDLLMKRGNTFNKRLLRKKAFGEMHGDNYLWAKQTEFTKVLVLESQSFLYAYIYLTPFGEETDIVNSFHVRNLYYKWGYDKSIPKEITLAKLVERDFLPSYGLKKHSSDLPHFEGFCYEDNRDTGCVLSTDLRPYTFFPKASFENYKDALFSIELFKFWQPYLEDPSQLE